MNKKKEQNGMEQISVVMDDLDKTVAMLKAAHDTQRHKPSPSIRKPPTGDEQQDFFVPILYDVGTKDSRSIMDVAVFRLSKRDKRAGDIIRYELPDGYVEVKAGPDGMASIWDYDMVLMMVSHLTEAMNRYREGKGEKPGRTYRPHVSDILKFCRRGDGGKQADEVENALDRLKGTTIKSVRETGATTNEKRPMREVKAEGLISDYTVLSQTDTGKVASVEIEAPRWLYKEVTDGKRPDVLTVHPDYFLIALGIGRFVYRLARRAAGKGEAKWSFQTIYERSGSTGTFKKFTFTLRKLIETDDMPEYMLSEEACQVGPLLVMRHREAPPAALCYNIKTSDQEQNSGS
ncbi:replication initiator protein A [Xylella fastidiosa]|uniref:replication initiator protein A n=1 Tax=Xylella fastidiosa TaxID=2371 RepID=UPI000FFEE420|nr:replication protein RepA [Xylella fastidiosa subsp. multiplex]